MTIPTLRHSGSLSRPRRHRVAVAAVSATMLSAATGVFGIVVGIDGPRGTSGSDAEPAQVASAERSGPPTGTAYSAGFELNQGQADPSVHYLARMGARTVSLGVLGATVTGPGLASMRISVVGGNRDAAIEGVDRRVGIVNDLSGSDPTLWHVGIPTFASVAYRGVLPGVDLLFHDRKGTLEYDVVVGPGVDPSLVKLKVEGPGKPRIDAGGDLLLGAGPAAVRVHAPVIYQEAHGTRRPVTGGFRLDRGGILGFRVGTYDTSSPLVIDPTITFDTQVPDGELKGIAVDPTGRAHVVGTIGQPEFGRISSPTALGSAQAFVVRLSPDGQTVEYKTFLSGQDDDAAGGVAVDAAGRAFVTGTTKSDDFPTTPNAFQPVRPCARCFSQAFVSVLDQSGEPVYSTFLGADKGDFGLAIAVGVNGHAYVAGQARYEERFPTKAGFISSPCECVYPIPFVAEIDPAASGDASLLHSTLLSAKPAGSGGISAIAVDAAGAPYVTGGTFDSRIATTPGAFDAGPLKNGFKTFVTKLRPDFGGLAYSTLLQGSAGFDQAPKGIAVDAAGAVYVTGGTQSADFPSANSTGTRSLKYDAFVTKIDPSGSVLEYSTFLAGSGDDIGRSVALDGLGNLYVSGGTTSSDFPLVRPIPTAAGVEGFLAKLRPDGSTSYATRLPEGAFVAVDGSGGAYVAGGTSVLKVSTLPAISSVSPAAGPTAGGQVSLEGASLDEVAKVTVGGVDVPCGPSLACRPDAQSPGTLLHVTMPPRLEGTVDVTATNVDGTSNAIQFTYRAPVVTSIDLTTGPATGATVLRLVGTDLSGASVRFGTVPATSATVLPSGTEVTVTAPPHNAGPVPVTVTTPPGATATAPSSYTFVPAITGLVTPTGSTAGGDSILITGLGLSSTSNVSFGGTPAASFSVPFGHDDQVVAAVPARSAPGEVQVTLSAQGLDAVAVPAGADMFTYTDQPPKPATDNSTGFDTGATTKGDQPASPSTPSGPTSPPAPSQSASQAPAETGASGLSTTGSGGGAAPVSPAVPAANAPAPAAAPSSAASPGSPLTSPSPGLAPPAAVPSGSALVPSNAPGPASQQGVAVDRGDPPAGAERYAMNIPLGLLVGGTLGSVLACLVLVDRRRRSAPQRRRAYAGVPNARRH